MRSYLLLHFLTAYIYIYICLSGSEFYNGNKNGYDVTICDRIVVRRHPCVNLLNKLLSVANL